VKKLNKTGNSFRLNARGSLVRLTRDEIDQVIGSYGNEASEPGGVQKFMCNSYTNTSGCDWNWVTDY
jgi:hypothetical protein